MRSAFLLILVVAPIHLAGTQPPPKTPDPLAEPKQRLKRGNYAEARGGFAAAATQPAGAIGLSRAWRAEGESAKALAALEDGLKASPDHPDLLAERGDLFHALGRWDDALKDAQSVVAKNDKHFPARWVRARVLRDTGDLAAADQEVRWFVKAYSDASAAGKDITDPELLLTVGQAGTENATWHNRPQQFDFILNEVYRDTLKHDPDCWQAENLAGRMLLDKHNRPDALEAFDKALKINPRAAEALVGKGLVALQKLELKDAEQFADAALRVNPKHPEALRLKADVLYVGGDLATAERLLSAARAVNPRDAATLARLAACYHVLRKPDQFAAVVKEAETFDAKPAAFYHDLAHALEERKQYAKAAEFYRTAASLRPQLPGPRAGLGMLLLRKGDEAEARQLLDAAFKADPFHVKVKNSLRVLKELDAYATFETPHYTLRYDPKADVVLAAFVADYLEETHADLKKQFGYEPPGRTLVEVFSSHEMFSGRVIALPDLHTIGACSGRLVAMASPAAKGLNKPFNWARVIRHELTHVFNLTQTDESVPHWLTEGLAVRNEGGDRPTSWATLLRERVARGELLDLDTITLAFVRPRGPDEWTLAYAQSHLYVEYVVKTHGESVVGKLLEAYRSGAATDTVLKRVLGVEKAVFEKGYRAYLDEVVKTFGKRRVEKTMTFAELEAAAAKTPDDADLAARLANELSRRNKPAEAKKLVDAALAREKGHALASVVKARMLARDKDEAGARSVLEEAAKENPDDPRVLLALGKLLVDLKDLDAAAALFERGRKLAPLDGDWLDQLARIYAATDMKSELASVLGEIAAKDPDDLPVRLKLARAHAELGQHAAAEKAARDALFIDVNHEGARGLYLDALKAQKRDADAKRIAERFAQKGGPRP
jgi:tetratricopeptide (TPR) repeat protein